jgi:CO/xanthine dehydrogenase FAD-binding subunit
MVADPMSFWQNYYIAHSIGDALLALADAPGDSQIIAGGTDLLLDFQQGRHAPVDTLVDVSAIPEMNMLEIKGDEIFIGAAVPHKVIVSSPLVQEHCTALAEASGLIGGPQVRNTATLGGNVAHALPAADGTIALLALDAQAEVVDLIGSTRISLVELFEGPGKSTLNPGSELLTGFFIRLRHPGQSSAFKRIMRPQGVAIAILNLAVWLHCTGESILDVRIAVGPSGPVPRRMVETENYLRGKPFSSESINLAYETLLHEANFRTSRYRATEEYRQKMAGVLLESALVEAFQRSMLNEVGNLRHATTK